MALQNVSNAINEYGPFHLYTFSFERDDARLLGNQGKLKEAAQLYLELLETQETELGSEHRSTLRTKNDLAAVYTVTEELDKALPLLDVKVCEKVFGPEHPHTIVVAKSLANVMSKQGKFRESLSLLNKTLKICKQVAGPNHPKTLNALYNIGVAHYNLKELDKAAEVFQDLLPRQEEVHGKDHPKTMRILEVLKKCREILDERNDSIVNFVTLTLADLEIAQSMLEASNWNLQVALDLFFSSNSTEDIAILEKQDKALLP